MKRIITHLLICLAFAAQAQTIKQLKRDMYGIASDATEGRFTASPGYLRAARYMVKQLKNAGIKRAYLQPIPFSWDDYSGSLLTTKGKPYRHHAQNFIVVQRGIAGPGKWVVLAAGDTVKGKPAGVIYLPNARQANDWETTVIRQYRFGYMHYLPDGANVPDGLPTLLVSPSLAKMLAAGDSITVNMQYVSDAKTGYNVIGIVPGTGQKKAHQAIIVGAHLDHIGRIGKHIYNGANDDASGCVAGLSAAKMLAVHPAKRTVIAAFFCGEELDLKGSGWFADHLPVPLKDILMMINLEQLGSKHRSFKGVWALGDTVFRSAFDRAGGHFNQKDLQFSPIDSIREVLRNTDTYSFMNKRIPSLLLGSGGFDEHHTPQDKINLIDFAHLKKATGLLYRLIVLSGSNPR